MSIYTHKTYSMTCNNCGRVYCDDDKFADYDMMIRLAAKGGWKILHKNGDRGLSALITLCPHCKEHKK